MALRPPRGFAVALALVPVLASCSDGPGELSPPLPRDAGGPLQVEPLHPSLVLHAADYPSLRANATRAPWSDVAADALAYAASEQFDPSLPPFEAKTRMTDLCGALALAHVLAPSPFWVTRLRDTLELWEDYYLAAAPPGEGTLVRWQQSAMVQSIIALDVMHDDLDPAERESLVALLDGMILQWWANLPQDGTTSTPGITLVWALFSGRRALAEEATELYLERLLDNLTPSGVYGAGTGYAWVRQGGDRLAKCAPIDVLVHTGTRPDLYQEPKLKGLHEWMYRSAYTPRRTNLTFGDTDPTREVEGLLGYVQPYRAARFSPLAGRHAAWAVRDVRARPLLANYVLIRESLLDPLPPSSAVWGDCASFWEPGARLDSLMGALWSSRGEGSHSHKDVNAVHLYAYGENVLRNSGYCGVDVGVDATFDWNWIHDTAASSNTVTIAGADHVGKVGGGVVEGLTATGFDYAAAEAGPALAGGTHTRSLLMIHGELGRPGYFVLLDEVTTDVPGATVELNLHPDSALAAVVVPRREYEWTVQRSGGQPVGLTLFLGTLPVTAELLDGGLCAFDGNEHVGRFLRPTYVSGQDGRRNVVTLAVPHDAAHPAPDLLWQGAGGVYSGAAVIHPDATTDFVLESSGTAPVLLGGASFQGRATHVRIDDQGFAHYFVRHGRGFDDGGVQRTGFESDQDITVFARDREVHVISSGAVVTFHDPSLVGNAFRSPVGIVVSAGAGFVRIGLRPGRHAFDLHTGERL